MPVPLPRHASSALKARNYLEACQQKFRWKAKRERKAVRLGMIAESEAMRELFSVRLLLHLSRIKDLLVSGTQATLQLYSP